MTNATILEYRVQVQGKGADCACPALSGKVQVVFVSDVPKFTTMLWQCKPGVGWYW